MATNAKHVNSIALEQLNTDFGKYELYRNLLVTLCRLPYVIHFDPIRPFFDKVFGQPEVDMIYTLNHLKETNITFDHIKDTFISFAKEFYGNGKEFTFLIDFLYSTISQAKMHDDIGVLSASLLYEDKYMEQIMVSRKPITSFLPKLKYLRGTINIVAAPPGGGKSLFLMHECIYQTLINNYNVWLFVSGDMDESAVMIRLYSIAKHYEQMYNNYFVQKNIIIKEQLNKFKIIVRRYSEINIYDVASIVKSSNADFICIDYDDKFTDLERNDTLYEAAARPYLVMDQYKDGRVIIFASQIKPQSYYMNKYMPMGLLQGSSKKEHIADQIITIREHNDANNIFVIQAIKDRHGYTDISQPIHHITVNNGIISEIDASKIKSKKKKNNNMYDDDDDFNIPF